MKAQSCPLCKAVTVRAERITRCLSCGEPMPEPVKPEPKPQMWADHIGHAENVKPQTWQEWKDSEPARVTEDPSTEVIAEFQTVNEEVAQIYSLVYGFLSKNNPLIKARETKTETLCDFGFFCRELESVFNELRKEALARKELCGSICAARKTQEAIADPSIKLKINAQFCTGSPDVKMQAKLPVKMTEEYFALTDYFQIPREVAAAGAVRLDWKGTGKFLTELAATGKKVPPGFGHKYPTYVTVFRRKKVVTL